jgi:hypothetical protein
MDQAVTAGAPLSDIPLPARRSAVPSEPRPLRATGIAAIVLVGALLIAAIAAGFSSLYRLFWGPEAFVERYIGLLADGRAADALTLPGVALDSSDLEEAGLPLTVSDALLRTPALSGDITDVSVTSSRMVDDVAEVTVAYLADGERGTSTFRVEHDGWSGLVPGWRFETSPLAVLDVAVYGSMRFTVNDFELDKRQVSPDGTEADPVAPVSMLVFTPGSYAVSVDTPAAEADPVPVLAEQPLTEVAARVQSQPSDAFADVIAEKVHDFLDQECTTQSVLKPTGCPFGFESTEIVFEDTVKWSIVQYPKVAVVPNGAFWAIAPAGGIARIEMDARSVFDGSVIHYDEQVTFTIDGTVDILADDTAQIMVGSPNL